MNIIKAVILMLKSKLFILYVKNGDSVDKITSNIKDISFIKHVSDNSKETLINTVGVDNYSADLETYDTDLFNAYKECDYQIARSNYMEAELNYYKLVNNPMGGDANVAFVEYKRLQKLKKDLDNFK